MRSGLGGADVDEVIEAREGRSVQQIFDADGEAAFRELEERVTLELLDDPELRPSRSAAARSVSERIREALQRVRVVWLDVEVDHAWKRVGKAGGHAPAGARPAGASSSFTRSAGRSTRSSRT